MQSSPSSQYLCPPPGHSLFLESSSKFSCLVSFTYPHQNHICLGFDGSSAHLFKSGWIKKFFESVVVKSKVWVGISGSKGESWIPILDHSESKVPEQKMGKRVTPTWVVGGIKIRVYVKLSVAVGTDRVPSWCLLLPLPASRLLNLLLSSAL